MPFLQAQARGQLSQCKTNLKNIATGLEMYASDNWGRYPKRLETLVQQRYLKSLPTCPAARTVTYLDYRSTATPDSFSFSCTGENHWLAWRADGKHRPNYPDYDAERG